MVRTKSEYADFDGERLARRLWDTYGDAITDADTFNESYDKYLTRDYQDDLTNKQDTILRKKVFEHITNNHKSVIEERSIQKRKGAPRTNFPKVDGKQLKDGQREANLILDKRKKRQFTHIRYVGTKVVYASEETITYLTKKKDEIIFTERKRKVYRDRFGRLTSAKRKGKPVHQVV